jgi:hypothetical protein
LNTRDLIYYINEWVSSIKTDKQDNPTLYSNFLNSKRLICESIFKTFIENGVNLHTFKFEIVTDNNEFYNSIIKLILQTPNFINNAKNLMIGNFDRLTNIEKDTIIENTTHMIKSQKNLKKIIFRYSNHILYDSLLSLKNSNSSNTLKTIIFYQIDFSNIFIFKEVFEQLNVLESIHMIYCRFFNSDFIQQINELNKPFKLRSLYILSKTYHVGSIRLLIQKAGNYLENFGFGFECYKLKRILKLITKYCNKIKYLELPGFIDGKIYSVFDLIKNIGQNLNYLDITFHGMYIDYYVEELTELSSIILKNLGQILPLRLEYLYLFLYAITTIDLEIFLNNIQNTFIENLLINYITAEYEDILFNLLDKYIVKKKRVRYLGLTDNLYNLSEDNDVIIKYYGGLVYNEFYDCINKRY